MLLDWPASEEPISDVFLAALLEDAQLGFNDFADSDSENEDNVYIENDSDDDSLQYHEYEIVHDQENDDILTGILNVLADFENQENESDDSLDVYSDTYSPVSPPSSCSISSPETPVYGIASPDHPAVAYNIASPDPEHVAESASPDHPAVIYNIASPDQEPVDDSAVHTVPEAPTDGSSPNNEPSTSSPKYNILSHASGTEAHPSFYCGCTCEHCTAEPVSVSQDVLSSPVHSPEASISSTLAVHDPDSPEACPDNQEPPSLPKRQPFFFEDYISSALSPGYSSIFSAEYSPRENSCHSQGACVDDSETPISPKSNSSFFQNVITVSPISPGYSSPTSPSDSIPRSPSYSPEACHDNPESPFSPKSTSSFFQDYITLPPISPGYSSPCSPEESIDNPDSPYSPKSNSSSFPDYISLSPVSPGGYSSPLSPANSPEACLDDSAHPFSTKLTSSEFPEDIALSPPSPANSFAENICKSPAACLDDPDLSAACHHCNKKPCVCEAKLPASESISLSGTDHESHEHQTLVNKPSSICEASLPAAKPVPSCESASASEPKPITFEAMSANNELTHSCESPGTVQELAHDYKQASNVENPLPSTSEPTTSLSSGYSHCYFVCLTRSYAPKLFHFAASPLSSGRRSLKDNLLKHWKESHNPRNSFSSNIQHNEGSDSIQESSASGGASDHNYHCSLSAYDKYDHNYPKICDNVKKHHPRAVFLETDFWEDISIDILFSNNVFSLDESLVTLSPSSASYHESINEYVLFHLVPSIDFSHQTSCNHDVYNNSFTKIVCVNPPSTLSAITLLYDDGTVHTFRRFCLIPFTAGSFAAASHETHLQLSRLVPYLRSAYALIVNSEATISVSSDSDVNPEVRADASNLIDKDTNPSNNCSDVSKSVVNLKRKSNSSEDVVKKVPKSSVEMPTTSKHDDCKCSSCKASSNCPEELSDSEQNDVDTVQSAADEEDDDLI